MSLMSWLMRLSIFRSWARHRQGHQQGLCGDPNLRNIPEGARWHIRTDNAIKHLNLKICRCIRVVGTSPDDMSALKLVTSRLKYVTESDRESRRYLDMTLLDEKPHPGWNQRLPKSAQES